MEIVTMMTILNSCMTVEIPNNVELRLANYWRLYILTHLNPNMGAFAPRSYAPIDSALIYRYMRNVYCSYFKDILDSKEPVIDIQKMKELNRVQGISSPVFDFRKLIILFPEPDSILDIYKNDERIN